VSRRKSKAEKSQAGWGGLDHGGLDPAGEEAATGDGDIGRFALREEADETADAF